MGVLNNRTPKRQRCSFRNLDSGSLHGKSIPEDHRIGIKPKHSQVRVLFSNSKHSQRFAPPRRPQDRKLDEGRFQRPFIWGGNGSGFGLVFILPSFAV